MRKTAMGALMVVLAATGVATADSLPKVGVMADVGLPDGGTAALVFRPVSLVRLSGGVSHNGIGPGVRAGVTLIPLSSWITPTLSATYGHYFERDANPVARMLSGDGELSSPALEHVGYDYGDAHLGLELGRKRVTFYLHAGVTRVQTHARDLDAAAAAGADGSSDVTVTFTQDPSVTLTTLSARLGFVVYL